MSNKTVTFGGVFHFPTLPKHKEDVKKAEAEGKSVSIKNRFNCGSLRNSLKMVGSNGNTLIAIRLVRSKLRKREDTLPTTTATPATNNSSSTTTNHNNNNIQQANNHNHLLSSNQNTHQQQQQQPPVQQTDITTSVSQTTENLPPPFLWVYHTNGSSTTASSQYTLYNNDQDTLVHNLQCEEPRECKGLRKNLRGKWRRLIKKKPPQEVYSIPAELKDQLKQIYVY